MGNILTTAENEVHLSTVCRERLIFSTSTEAVTYTTSPAMQQAIEAWQAHTGLSQDDLLPYLLEQYPSVFRERRHTEASFILYLLMAICGLMVVSIYLLGRTAGLLKSGLSWQLLYFLGTMTYLGGLVGQKFLERKQKSSKDTPDIFLALAGFHDRHTIIPLIEVEPFGLPHSPLLPALSERLWSIRPEDGLLLQPKHRAILRHQLKRFARQYNCGQRYADDISNEQTDFLVATLKALATIGDKDTLPLLRRWITAEVDTINANTVRSAAQECQRLLETTSR
jgi:hypothetical protein